MKTFPYLFFSLYLSFFTNNLFSQGQISASAITENVVLLHIDEGYVDYHGAGENTQSDEIFYDDNLYPEYWENFSLDASFVTSATDPNFTELVYPISVSRKSKPTEFANFCESWEYLDFFDTFGCANELDHVKEHFLYLKLPINLTAGNSYSLNTYPFITDDLESFSFIYDPKIVRSPAIHVNNIGYSTDAELKYGYVYHWTGDGGSLDLSEQVDNTFDLIDVNTNESVYSGTMQFRANANTVETFQTNPAETPNQNFLGSTVYECDFSDFNTPGKYRLSVEGIGCSYDFKIACDALRPAFETAMKGLFHNRSGIELLEEHTDFPRAAPHNVEVTPDFAGRLKYTNTTICEVSNADASEDDKALWDAGIVGDLEKSWGWYQDAGDWDAYISHLDIPTKLLFAYEHFPNNFTDEQLNIPESGNSIPDILDEARWLLRFYKRLKDETESKSWTTGGVPGGRIFADLWGEDLPNEIGRGSWQDNDRDWIVSGEEPLITFYYAGIAAHYAYILEREGLTDPENIDWETEAINAYAWADENYESGYFCHEYQIPNLKNYASAALWRLTAASSYEAGFQTSYTDVAAAGNGQLQGREGYGAYIYAASENTNSSTLQAVMSVIEATADWYLLTNIEQRACRWGGNHFFPMLVGHGTTPLVFEGVMGYVALHDINPDKAANYKKYLYTTADYFLGTNPLNMTWMTGLGENSPKYAFHLDSFYGNEGESVSGIVPYGPWQDVDLFGVQGPFNHTWVRDKVYPSLDEWPGHERWFEQRPAPLSNEFTIHQNTLNAAFLYGVLSGDYACTETVTIKDSSLPLGENFIIYPNPVKNMLRIDNPFALSIDNLRLVNANGSQIKDLKGTRTEIDLSNLASGVYFLEITSSNFTEIKKIIKQ